MKNELPNNNRLVPVEIEFEINGVTETHKVHILTDAPLVVKLQLLEPEKWSRFKLACQQELSRAEVLPVDNILAAQTSRA